MHLVHSGRPSAYLPIECVPFSQGINYRRSTALVNFHLASVRRTSWVFFGVRRCEKRRDLWRLPGHAWMPNSGVAFLFFSHRERSTSSRVRVVQGLRPPGIIKHAQVPAYYICWGSFSFPLLGRISRENGPWKMSFHTHFSPVGAWIMGKGPAQSGN